MAGPDTTRYQINYKTPGGALINIYADDEFKAKSYLEALQTLAPDIAATEALLSGTQVVAQQLGGTPVQTEQFAPPSQGPAPSFAQPAPQQAAPAAAPGGGPVCQHGPMTFRSGTGKRGPWTAHFCPTPRGTPGQCDPVWG